MTRSALALTGCLLVQAIVPAPAQANIWRWIDELSGPGPFKGYQYESRIICFPAGTKAGGRVDKRSALALGGLGPCIIDLVPEDGDRLWSVNTSVGWFRTDRNPLVYEPDIPAEDRKVTLTTFETTLSWQFVRGLDLGVGGGVYWFGGRQFDSFSRVALIPFRIDVRPFEATLCKESRRKLWWLTMLSLRFDVVVIPRGFDGADFGARPDRFAPRDTLKNYAIMADLAPLFRKIPKPAAKAKHP